MQEVATKSQPTARPSAPVTSGDGVPRLGYLLKHAQRRYQELTVAAFATLDIRPTEWVALTCLDEQRELSQKDVAELLGIDRTTMVAVVDELQSKGLVERRPQTEDRRKNSVGLTPSGREMMQRGARLADECEQRFLAGLDEPEALQLKKALEIVITSTSRAASRNG